MANMNYRMQTVGSLLDIRRLRYFLTIIRCGSMASASRELNVAQPALSHHMSELERIVGFSLLERLPRGVRPTPGGQILLDHAKVILENVARAERDMRAFAASDSRDMSIRIGLLPSWVLSFGDFVLRMTKSRFPDHTVLMLEVRNDEAERMINRNEIDVATMLDSAPQFPRAIHEEPLFLASSKPLPPSVRFDELTGMDLVLASSSHQFRQDIERTANEYGVTLKVVLEVDGYVTLKKAVEQGIGNTVISWNSIRNECASGLMYAAPIVSPPLKRPVYLRRAPGFDLEIAASIYDILKQAATLPAESLNGNAFNERHVT
ncbi:MAG TPA: LysR family transcriptional regulator [Rhizobium sp.]